MDLTAVRAAEEAEHSAEEQGLLTEIRNLLSSSRDPEGDFERFANLVCKLVPVDRVSLVMSGENCGDKLDLVDSKLSDTQEVRITSGEGSLSEEETPEMTSHLAPFSDGGEPPAEAQRRSDPSNEVNPIYCPII